VLTYSSSIIAASVKVLEKSAPPDMQVTFAPGSFKGGQIGELEEKPGLSAGAWQMRPLSRGYVEAKSNRLANHAGNQPALPLGGTRPARHHRRSAAGAAIFAVPALQPFVWNRPLSQRRDTVLGYGAFDYFAECRSL